MTNSLLRGLSCLAFLAVIGVPAQGEGIGYAQMPETLFAPDTNPNRETAAEIVVIERETAPPKRVMSHGRQVRLIGVPFMPDPEESIDFESASESIRWSTFVVHSLAAWLAPIEAIDAPTVASTDKSPRVANLETAANFVIE